VILLANRKSRVNHYLILYIKANILYCLQHILKTLDDLGEGMEKMSDTLRKEIREKIANGDFNCEKELTLSIIEYRDYMCKEENDET
jgi:hypothetical protein